MSSFDLIGGFRTPADAVKWAKAFGNAFPQAKENGVAVIHGGNTVAIRIGIVDDMGIMRSPDACVTLELNQKKKWEVTDFFLKEDYFNKGQPQGRLLDLQSVLLKEKNPAFMIGRLIDTKASGETLHKAVFAADNMGYIAGFIEDVDAGRHVPHEVSVKAVEMGSTSRIGSEFYCEIK